MLLWHWHLFRVKNIDLRARQGRKCQILTLKFLYLGPKVFFCLFLSTAHITTTTSGATTFPYFPKLKYDVSCVDLGLKLLSRYSPKMAKILVEPWKRTRTFGGLVQRESCSPRCHGGDMIQWLNFFGFQQKLTENGHFSAKQNGQMDKGYRICNV